ncbi:MAG: hypothetical protein H0X27_02870 [Caulobacteraceae bacterium]|nr:hypothetical protein [Caulobacteraceae bacterium]
MPDYEELTAARDRAVKAMSVPVGAASPLWLAFGAAASAGVAWWWMTRWARAVNIEAAMEPSVEATAPRSIEPSLAAVETSDAEPAEATAPEAIAVSALAEAQSLTAAPEPDDLTRLVGIGPKLAEALAARGVTNFAHLAAWTAEDLANVDSALSLKGRAVRDAWVAQAKRLSAEG